MVLCFSLLLTLLLVLGAGCQKSTTTGQVPSTQTDQAQAQANKTQGLTTQAAALKGTPERVLPKPGEPITPAAGGVGDHQGQGHERTGAHNRCAQ